MLNEKGAELLKKVIQAKYENINLDKKYSDEDEFYYEFRINEQVSENDFDVLESEMKQIDEACYVKLLRVGGVYYDGNINNCMITRIVGKCFASQEELDKYN